MSWATQRLMLSKRRLKYLLLASLGISAILLWLSLNMWRRDGQSLHTGTPLIFDKEVSELTFYIASCFVAGPAVFAVEFGPVMRVLTLSHILINPVVLVLTVDWLIRRRRLDNKARK